MTRQNITICDIILRLKIFYDIKKDYELAKILNVSTGKFAMWKQRNTVPYDVITKHCFKTDLNYYWVIYGEGEMLNDKAEIKQLKKESSFMEGKVSNLKNKDKEMVFDMIERLQPE